MPHTRPAPTRRRPSARLILLTAVVMLAHWAVLRAAPLTLAAHESPDAGTGWTFTTRTLAAPGAADPSAGPVKERLAAPARRPPAPRSAPTPNPTAPQNSEQKAAVAPVEYASPAIETIAPAVTIDAPPDTDVPTLLAAATPVATPITTPADTVSAATPVPAAPASPPPATKAVQHYVFPPSARLKYEVKGEVKGFPYHVNGELRWVQDGKTYNARMEISHFLLGSRVQTSVGLLGAHGLEPTRFGDKVRSEVAAHFDRDKNKVTFSANTPDAPLLPGAQDQLSVFMQLGAMLAGEPGRITPASSLSFQAVGPRSSDTWVFTVGASENLVLPGGEISAVRLWRDPAGEYDPKAEIWLAPSLGYLPVRIRLTQRNGDFVDQQWRGTEK